MKTLIDKCVLYYGQQPDFNEAEILSYVQNLSDWRGGTKADGSEINRKQKWHNVHGDYFTNTWRKRPPRWNSCEWDPFLESFMRKVQEWVNRQDVIPPININSVLINYYRDENDYIKRHRDDVSSFGATPTILNMSFGDTRDIVFTNSRGAQITQTLESGSVLVMMGDSQVDWIHEIPRGTKPKNARWSFTWREKIG